MCLGKGKGKATPGKGSNRSNDPEDPTKAGSGIKDRENAGGKRSIRRRSKVVTDRKDSGESDEKGSGDASKEKKRKKSGESDEEGSGNKSSKEANKKSDQSGDQSSEENSGKKNKSGEKKDSSKEGSSQGIMTEMATLLTAS